MTADELANICHVSRQAIHNWIANGMPIEKKGARGKRKKTTVDLVTAMTWYFRENFEKLELDRARARLAHAQAVAAEKKNGLLAGDLVSISAVQREFTGALMIVRQNALGLANKLAPILENRVAIEIKTILDREMRALLENIANFDFSKPGEHTDETQTEGREAAAQVEAAETPAPKGTDTDDAKS